MQGRCGPPSGEELATTPSPERHPSSLSFLKTTENCTAVAVARAAPVWAFQQAACPRSGAWIMLLGKGSGPNRGAGPCSSEHQRWSSQTSLPAPPELGRGLRAKLGAGLCGFLISWVLIKSVLSSPYTPSPGATRSQSSCEQTFRSSAAMTGCLLPAPLSILEEGVGGGGSNSRYPLRR